MNMNSQTARLFMNMNSQKSQNSTLFNLNTAVFMTSSGCDAHAELQTSLGGQRADTPPLRRLLHPSPSILPGIMAAGHASRYKTGLRSEPNRYRYTYCGGMRGWARANHIGYMGTEGGFRGN